MGCNLANPLRYFPCPVSDDEICACSQSAVRYGRARWIVSGRRNILAPEPILTTEGSSSRHRPVEVDVPFPVVPVDPGFRQTPTTSDFSWYGLPSTQSTWLFPVPSK